MYAVDLTTKTSAMASQTGMWMLTIFFLGLAIMAWLTIREVSPYEAKRAIKNLRRSRKPNIPERERLPMYSRLNVYLRSYIRGGEFLDPFQDQVAEGRAIYQDRLRREIETMVGKAVYHGLKEQLKPPTKPTQD